MNEIKSIINWECVKSKMYLRLVNYEKNKADIEGKVYVKYLDLAILIHCDYREWGLDGFYVGKKHLRMWNQSIKDIFQTAMENTYCKNNTLVTPIMNLLPQEAVHEVPGKMNITGEVMTVLTSRSLSFGAAMLLNVHELKKLADRLDSDLYLLPSSVHEILAVCSRQTADVSYLMDTVNEVNNVAVGPEEYLSDNVYFFDRETCEVTIARPA